MEIFRGAAVLVGDLVTQPVRAKVAELVTGREVSVSKVIEESTLKENGSFRSGRVRWELEYGEKKNPST